MKVEWFILVLCVIIPLCVGFIFGMLISMRRKRKYDGTLLITAAEDRDQFQFIFSTELEDLQKQTELIMKIEHSQNPQPL